MFRLFALMLIVILTTSCDKNKIIYVADSLADCEGNATKKCLQVKENKEDEWTLINQDIEEFEFIEGITQKIEVTVKKIKNPPTDGAVFNYKFVRLISKSAEVPFSLILDKNHDGKWQVNTMVGMDSLAKQPTMIFKDGQISGNSGCNNYGATYTLSGSNIAFSLSHTTKMYCTNINVEKAYINCLSQVKTYKLADELTFYDANNVELMSCSLIKE